MKVFTLQQLGLTFCQPLGSGQGLAFGAVPIRARIISIPLMTAMVTAFEMATERGGTALLDGAQHTLLSAGQRYGMRPAKLVTMGAHHIGGFQCRSHQSLPLRSADRA